LKNSAIRNYEKRTEPHFGGRSTFTYSTTLQQTKLKWVTGAEAQQGYFNVRVFKNNKGNPDSLQTDDEVNTNQIALFTQAELSFTRGWIFTAGVSWNNSNVEIRRTSLVPNFLFNSDYKNEWAPRFSLLKQINNHWSWYGVVSKGFSPPTTQELLPSTSVINTTLQAEQDGIMS
jgi:iron complex outermembrane receptor protein